MNSPTLFKKGWNLSGVGFLKRVGKVNIAPLLKNSAIIPHGDDFLRSLCKKDVLEPKAYFFIDDGKFFRMVDFENKQVVQWVLKDVWDVRTVESVDYELWWV